MCQLHFVTADASATQLELAAANFSIDIHHIARDIWICNFMRMTNVLVCLTFAILFVRRLRTAPGTTNGKLFCKSIQFYHLWSSRKTVCKRYAGVQFIVHNLWIYAWIGNFKRFVAGSELVWVRFAFAVVRSSDAKINFQKLMCREIVLLEQT